MKTKVQTLIASGVMVSVLALLAPTVSAQLLFSENFDLDPTANWVINTVGDGSDADFFFDYSTIGIPSAPNSTGGTTRGLKMRANIFGSLDGFPDGISVSPLGQSFSGDYELRFDMWINYNGPLPAGGNGSTQVTGAGIGTAGNAAQVAGAADSIHVGTTGDGGSGADYRVYAPAAQVSYQDGDPVYAATNRNNTNPYYSGFGGESAPAAQLALFSQQTGSTSTGAQGFAWRDVRIKKFGDTVTWEIDGLLLATVDLTTAGTLGGSNILFNQYDITVAASTDSNSLFLSFGLIDNVRVSVIDTINASAPTPEAAEAGPVNGQFTLTRVDTSETVTVNYALSGTASNGVDYVSLPGSVTMPAGVASTNITVTPIDDALTEPVETVILTITPDPGYVIGIPSATVTIADNEPATVSVTATAPTMYERHSQDRVIFELTRLGNTNTSVTVNLSYAGSAGNGVDYINAPPSVIMNPGEVTAAVTANPQDDSTQEGDETIMVTITSVTGGAVGTPVSASATILDDELGPETVLYSDNFETDTSANWTVLFGSGDGVDDRIAAFAYDYSAENIPPAPGSNTTRGLKLSVNKNDLVASAAGINAYPNSQNFSGDYALRFNMYSILNSSGGTTERSLFGINHSGTKTNWINNSAAGTPLDIDGLWYSFVLDSSLEAGLGHVLFTGNGPSNPALVVSNVNPNTLVNVFKNPPFALAGSPVNASFSINPAWVDVEVRQVGGVITCTLNGTVIMQTTNTTSFTSGNIMVGHNDGFNSVGLDSATIIDNLRVIDLTVPTITITAIAVIDSNVQIDFSGATSDTPGSFSLRKSSTVGSGYAVDGAASIIQLSPGNFRATTAVSGPQQYFRISKP